MQFPPLCSCCSPQESIPMTSPSNTASAFSPPSVPQRRRTPESGISGGNERNLRARYEVIDLVQNTESENNLNISNPLESPLGATSSISSIPQQPPPPLPSPLPSTATSSSSLTSPRSRTTRRVNRHPPTPTPPNQVLRVEAYLRVCSWTIASCSD